MGTIMSDRIKTITVVLERDTRTEDCEAILNAIRMTKDVLSATPNVADGMEHMAVGRKRREMRNNVWKAIYPKFPDDHQPR